MARRNPRTALPWADTHCVKRSSSSGSQSDAAMSMMVNAALQNLLHAGARFVRQFFPSLEGRAVPFRGYAQSLVRFSLMHDNTLPYPPDTRRGSVSRERCSPMPVGRLARRGDRIYGAAAGLWPQRRVRAAAGGRHGFAGWGERFNGTITFLPADGKSPAAILSLTNGEYQFNRHNGPSAGPHRVIVNKVLAKGPMLQSRGSRAASGRAAAGGPAKTQWTQSANVTAEGPYRFDFHLD